MTARPSSALTLVKSCDWLETDVFYRTESADRIKLIINQHKDADYLKYYELHHTNSLNDLFVSIHTQQCGSCETCDDVHMTLSFFIQGSHVFSKFTQKKELCIFALRRTQNVMQVNF